MSRESGKVLLVRGEPQVRNALARLLRAGRVLAGRRRYGGKKMPHRGWPCGRQVTGLANSSGVTSGRTW